MRWPETVRPRVCRACQRPKMPSAYPTTGQKGVCKVCQEFARSLARLTSQATQTSKRLTRLRREIRAVEARRVAYQTAITPQSEAA